MKNKILDLIIIIIINNYYFCVSDGEYLFVDPENKLSKYAPKNWRSSHTYVSSGFLKIFSSFNF